jgi:hypothetical protein
MGCSNSDAIKSISINKYVDTDDFNEKDFPHFQNNFYDKNIKNIKKVYEERINEGNNVITKIHKIFVAINYAKHNTTNIRIEIEKKDGQIVKKHLTRIGFDYECSLDNEKKLLELYNAKFKINSIQWYHLNRSTDIYIKVEKINDNLFKIFEMFYEKEISKLKINKIIKFGNSENSSEARYFNIKPGEVVKKYNELKSIYYDNKPEIFNYDENSKKSVKNENSKKNENYNHENYSNHQNDYSNYNNYSYHDNNSNNNNQSNHDNNESQKHESNRSGIMRDDCHQIVGRIDRDGVIRDENYNEVGRFDNGIIRDDSFQEVARYDDNGVFRNDDGEIGNVNSDGLVKDDSGNVLGHISDDGDVKDDEGNIIGNAEGMTNEEAAYMYFFK